MKLFLRKGFDPQVLSLECEETLCPCELADALGIQTETDERKIACYHFETGRWLDPEESFEESMVFDLESLLILPGC